MRCEHCGSPIEPGELERGSCAHCGVVLSRPEPAPRALPDSAAPTRSPGNSWPALIGAIIGLTFVGGMVAFFSLGGRSDRARPAGPAPVPAFSEQPTTIPPESIATVTSAAAIAPTTSSTPTNLTGAARPATTERVIAAHRGKLDRCQREELARSPSAPHRYSLAITVGPTGAADWVELLSEASPAMKACVEGVAKSLAYPKPSAGSQRSVVTLDFGTIR